ncbi:ABC transporter permease subunit [Actinocrispum wychmicini]|uniref:ABC-2 family transporter n=1 Tax=Actinocrispum wychmicini TaxID=1213861 RepID=A0A4V2S8Z1_9PSEU|nr:ABC transporter permease subunit [Actinocrispum wychmicini]TCO65760.1 ABC-2 family transporter [Actinocrispum wychmicini]
MSLLLSAEYRKVFSTKLWWALLIPAAVVSLAFTWGGAAIGALGELSSRGPFPVALPAFAQGISIATVFALILGGTAVTGEMRHKTITTSYLTAPSRGSVLVAKQLVYASMGALYGLVCMLAATLGALLGDNFPDAKAWFTVAGVGVIAMILWTLFGVGLGALIGNQLGTIVGGVVYAIVVEPIANTVMRFNDLGEIPPFLPNKTSSDMVSTLSMDLFVQGLPAGLRRGEYLDNQARELLGLQYSPSWWGSGLLFIAWTTVFGLAGHLTARRRDIT